MSKKLVLRCVSNPHSGLAFWCVVESKTTIKLPRYDGSDMQEILFSFPQEDDDNKMTLEYLREEIDAMINQCFGRDCTGCPDRPGCRKLIDNYRGAFMKNRGLNGSKKNG